MASTARNGRPAWVRVSSRTAGLVGVRFYNMLYGERSLVDPRPRVEPPPGLSIRWAGDRDLERMALELAPRQVESCRLAVTQQSRCLLASIGDEIAGYCWLNTEDIYLLRWKVQALPAE